MAISTRSCALYVTIFSIHSKVHLVSNFYIVTHCSRPFLCALVTDSVLASLLLISHNSCVLLTGGVDSSLFSTSQIVTEHSIIRVFPYHHTTAPCCAIKFLLVVNDSSLQLASVYEGIVLSLSVAVHFDLNKLGKVPS